MQSIHSTWRMIVKWVDNLVVCIIGITLGFILLSNQRYPNIDSLDASESSVRLASNSSIAINKVLQGLHRIVETSKTGTSKHKCERIAVGYNANLDLIVKAKDLLHQLHLNPSTSATDHEKISSLQQFEEAFAYFFQRGTAAERFVDRNTFKSILEAVDRIPESSKQWFTGGNAALMANRFVAEGCERVLLGGHVKSKLRSHLHPNISLLEEYEGEYESDEIHLILEYERGAQWGSVQSPRANRFILNSDETNSKIVPLEAFHAALQSFHPSLVVISGLHLLEGQSKEFRENRLAAVRAAIRDATIAKDTMIHLELASIGDITLTQQIVNSMLADVDSLGLNEQELGSVFTVLNGKPAGDAFKDPKSRLTIQTLKQLFSHVDKIHKESPHSVRRLSRVHFHCISYHLIVQRRGSSWADAKTAVASASLAASKQACDTARPSPSQFYLLAPLHLQQHEDNARLSVALNLNEPVAAWTEGELELFYAPVLVCKAPTKTVGLGDAISTVGLVTQLYR